MRARWRVRGIPFPITAAGGFIALFCVAYLSGLVIMSAIRKFREEGLGEDEATTCGAMERVRPVLMTPLVASLSFVPMALATGTGAEAQRSLAAVMWRLNDIDAAHALRVADDSHLG